MDQHERFTLHWTAAQSVVGSYIGSLVPDFQEAEDLLQEVALVLLRKFAEYDERRPFVAWALGVAKYEILSSRRRHARSFLTAQSDVLENLMTTYIDLAPELDRRASALRECLRQIQGRAAEMIRLRYEESLKPGEIAIRLGLAAAAVRMALSRSRAFLRDCIERRLKLEDTSV
jgi:RNA polymerase sigma-70 factor, ECF subfamily